ncbi:MAG: hypothetical protein LUQ22_07805 [Methanotrichaceae archaeon]|nr:hypothetical protein [Methanotrichaceae archaeon]
MMFKPARWIWVVMQPHYPHEEKYVEALDTQYAHEDVSLEPDIFSVTFFDLSGIVYALPGIYAACSLVVKRFLTAEEERIVIKRSVHAEPVAEAFDQSQETMMLITNDTGRLVAFSPSSSHYGVILEVT